MAVPYARACVASALSEVSVSPFEHGLMLRWHKEGKSTTEIAELLQRGHGTVSRHVRQVSSASTMEVQWKSNGSPMEASMEAPMEAEKTQAFNGFAIIQKENSSSI